MSATASMFSQSFFYGTRVDLKPGDMITVGHQSNFTEAGALSWVYLTGTLGAQNWLSAMDGSGFMSWSRLGRSG